MSLRPALLTDLVPGAEVFYSPILGERRFRGVVRCEPWLLGHGAWCTHLRDMEDDYAAHVGQPGRRVVHAALLEALFATIQAQATPAEGGGA